MDWRCSQPLSDKLLKTHLWRCLTTCGWRAAQMLHALLGEQVGSELQKRGVRAAVEALVGSTNAEFWRQDVLLVRPGDTHQDAGDEDLGFMAGTSAEVWRQDALLVHPGPHVCRTG